MSGFTTVKGFEVRNPVLVMEVDARNQIWAFEGNSMSRHAKEPIYRISKVYKMDSADGEWNPGKGIEVPLSKKDELLVELKKLT